MIVKAVERLENHVRLIDQTRLPGELVYLDIDRYEEIIEAIKRLAVRGAPAIGIAAAYGLALGVQQARNADPACLLRVATEIKNARPTAVNLSWAVDRVLARAQHEKPNGLEALLAVLWSEAEAIHEEDQQMCRRIGEHGAALVNDGDTILTHCNTGALATGGIGTALAVVYTCHEQGKRVKVYADETRPLLQGARLTAWELQQAGIDVTLICDSTAAMLMRQQRIDMVILGADRIARNGDTANKIGTYAVAVQAKEHGVPFYVAAPASTFDELVATGQDIPIEERSADEITAVSGCRVAPDRVKVYAPAFDVTPNDLITGFITDTGVKPGGRPA